MTYCLTEMRVLSLCNRGFWWRFCVVHWFSSFFGIGFFVIGLSQISFFFFLHIPQRALKPNKRHYDVIDYTTIAPRLRRAIVIT